MNLNGQSHLENALRLLLEQVDSHALNSLDEDQGVHVVKVKQSLQSMDENPLPEPRFLLLFGFVEPFDGSFRPFELKDSFDVLGFGSDGRLLLVKSFHSFNEQLSLSFGQKVLFEMSEDVSFAAELGNAFAVHGESSLSEESNVSLMSV